MPNHYRITLASFLAYFVMSGMLAPIGIISGPMALAYGLPVTELTAYFSWLTGGIFVGAVLALVAFAWFRIKTLMVLVYSLIALALASLWFDSSLTMVALRLGLVGVCCGVGLPAAALVISRIYAAERRASMLVITDGCFSVAGIVCSWLAAYLLALDGQWSSPYLVLSGVAIAIIVLSALSAFPEDADNEVSDPSPTSWPVAAWLCIIVLALYTLAQNSILLWLPQYAQTELGATPIEAGSLVGNFWSGMFVAQSFVAWWVLRVGVRRLLILAACSTLLFSMPLWLVADLNFVVVLAALWGFANLGLLKVVISYATQFTPIASPRLVSSLLLGATTGTAISPWVSSLIVASGDAGTALRFGSLGYFVMFLLVGVILSRSGRSLVRQNSS